MQWYEIRKGIFVDLEKAICIEPVRNNLGKYVVRVTFSEGFFLESKPDFFDTIAEARDEVFRIIGQMPMDASIFSRAFEEKL